MVERTWRTFDRVGWSTAWVQIWVSGSERGGERQLCSCRRTFDASLRFDFQTRGQPINQSSERVKSNHNLRAVTAISESPAKCTSASLQLFGVLGGATKTFPSQPAIAWLKQLALPEIDQLEMNHLLADLEHSQKRIEDLEEKLAQRCGTSDAATLLSSIPGVAAYTATALACRVGRVERFPRSRSLANYWGLTPGCRNSGEKNQRLGSITKAGSGMARWLLAHVAYQALKKDKELRQWYKRIKRRRGGSIARVAVMRKLATIIWHMLTKRISYFECRQLTTE